MPKVKAQAKINELDAQTKKINNCKSNCGGTKEKKRACEDKCVTDNMSYDLDADFEFGKEAEYEEVTRKDPKTVMRIKGKGTLKTQDGMSAMNQTTINRLKGSKLSEAGRQVNFANTRPKPQTYKSSGSNKTKKSKKKSSRYQDLKF